MAFIFFYNIVRRVPGTSDFYRDGFMSEEYWRLVNTYLRDASLTTSGSSSSLDLIPSSSTSSSLRRKMSIPIPFTKKYIPLSIVRKTPDDFSKYVNAKIRSIKKEMSSDRKKNAAFEKVSTEMLNLYHYIFEYAPT